MKHVMDNAEESVRRVIDRIGDGSFTYTMDDGSPLRSRYRSIVPSALHDGRLHRNRPAARRQLQRPPAVTRAVVLYVFRCLVGDDIPLNDGCLKPIDYRHSAWHLSVAACPGRQWSRAIPRSRRRPAMLCLAPWRLACSQATMNNFLFGDATRQYYETICGGTGAGPGFDGPPRPQPHDQHPHDRSRGPRAALSGAAGGSSRSAAAPAGRANGAVATALYAASASWSR